MNDEQKFEIEDGLLLKSANVELSEVTSEDLKKINKFTLSPLKAEDVFTFKVKMGDNETDDRNFEPFNLQALKDLKNLYIGKTVIKDHWRRADNQVARIYDTELITDPKLTKAGEPFTTLVAKVYMVKTESNKDLITEIKAGIKKEVSTGCRPKKLICNICGVDNMTSYCAHWAGRDYETAEGKKTCMMTIDGAKEAYELSLVAVPAQPRAGTMKHYGPKPEDKPQIEDQTSKDESKNEDLKALTAEVDAIESFIFTQKQEENENE